TIYWYASRRGWKSRAARHRPRLPRAEIRALYEDTIVPAVEIARLAGVVVQTIHVWAAKEGWKPRSTRLRGQRRAVGEIANLPAEVSAARERAGRVQVSRERAKKGGTYKRVWHSHEELMRMGLDGTARVYVRR